MGPLNDAMKAEMVEPAIRYPLRHRVDDACGVPGVPEATRHLAERGIVHWRCHATLYVIGHEDREPRPMSSIKCVPWYARPWRTARWASRHR